MKKSIILLLCAALCLSLSVGALASGEASGGPSGGPGQIYGASNEENSALAIKDGAVAENGEYGIVDLGASGEISAAGISGVKITGLTEEADGIYFATEEDDAVFTVGGPEEIYDVEGVGTFNTVVELAGPEDDPNGECRYGVGVTAAGGWLTLDNVYIHTSGYRASTVYTMSAEHETNLVVKDSVLRADGAPGGFMPDFKLLVGSARGTLFLGEDIWLYNSAFIARDWGALSHDTNTADIQLYAVNTYAETYNGGYVLYALDGTENFMYGSKFVSPQYGMFVMGRGAAVLDSVDAADEAALAHGTADPSAPVTADGRSLLAGGCNAVVFHVNGGVMEPGIFTVRNATVSTMPEDVTSDYGDEMVFDLDSYLLSPVKFGESWFYMENCLGSLIITRSHGGVISFEEGAELKAANGVLVQTLVGYDSDAGNIYHDSADTRGLADVTVNIDAPVSGDILHQDYQRNMFVNVDADYNGRVTTGSITAWNDLWSVEGLAALLEQGGHTKDFELSPEAVADIRSCLVREEDTAAYTDVFGVDMTVASGAVWTVEGVSSVLSLTVEEGAVVKAAEVYADCTFGADGYLDPSTGTKVDPLTAGTYENVVLIGGDAAGGDASGEVSAELPLEAMEILELGGEEYVRLDDLLITLLLGGR